jgi:hypothetical protein
MTDLIYSSPAYRKFLVKLLNAEDNTVIIRDGSGPDLVLPLLSIDGPHGRVANSLPFYGSHGIPKSSVTTPLSRTEALMKAESTIDELGFVSVTLVEDPFDPLGDEEVRVLSRLRPVTSRISQITHRPHEESLSREALMNHFHPKTRNAIRKGQTVVGDVSLESAEADAMEFLIRTHLENIERLGGIPKEPRVFELLHQFFGARCRVHVAREKDGKALAALLSLRHETTVEYFVPVVDHEHRSSQALSALIFEVMHSDFTEGVTMWNWGGTWESQSGVHRFKSRFGAVDRTYRYFHWCADQVKAAESSILMREYKYWFVRDYSL